MVAGPRAARRQGRHERADRLQPARGFEAGSLFTQHPSRFLGRVVHPDGRPAARAWVFIAAEDEKLRHPWSTTSHVVQAEADGTFSVVTLPGRYVARAFPPNRLVSTRGATDRISEIGSGGTPIVLGEREQKSVQLIVEPNGATRR